MQRKKGVSENANTEKELSGSSLIKEDKVIVLTTKKNIKCKH